jgi:hypothetical protein
MRLEDKLDWNRIRSGPPAEAIQHSPEMKARWLVQVERLLPTGSRVRIIDEDSPYKGQVALVSGYDMGADGAWPMVEFYVISGSKDGAYLSALELDPQAVVVERVGEADAETTLSAVVAQLKHWRRRLADVQPASHPSRERLNILAKEMREVIEDIEGARLHRRIEITRYWFEDRDRLIPSQERSARSASSPLHTHWNQVCDEFNEALPNRDGSSVIERVGDPTVKMHEDGNLTVTFLADLDFQYPLDKSFTSDADLIMHLFYEDGGVLGEFKMTPHLFSAEQE